MRMIESLRASGIRNEAVLSAMAEIPRHLFVDDAIASRAYDDTALPIGYSQTISAPSIVAHMTALILERANGGGERGKVLEIGTGCGYQTAVLGKLFKEVYTIERIEKLIDAARRNLRDLRYYNVRFKHGDGYLGYPEAAPYDAILAAASATHVPQTLKDQLAVGGRLVMPLDTRAGGVEQRLMVVDRDARGFKEQLADYVKFVPMLSGTT